MPLHRCPKQHSNKCRWKIYRTNMKSHPKSSLYSGFKNGWSSLSGTSEGTSVLQSGCYVWFGRQLAGHVRSFW
jgi:hypothetical protein